MRKMGVLLLAMVFLVGCSGNTKTVKTESATATQATTEAATTEVATTEAVTTEAVTETPTTEAAVEPFVPNPDSMRALAAAKGMYIGAAVDISFLDETKYADTLKNEFNMMTCENNMKMASIHTSEKSYIFAGADVAVNFAIQNGMQMRGHTLVWHQQLPLWLTNGKWTKDELLGILNDYIENMVGHYKGKINTWDVLNEIFNEDGTFRESIWYKTIGEEYIATALKKAREMDPAAKLIINDYNVETINAKSDALYNLVKKLQEDGVPIDGVGFQSHYVSDQIDFNSLAKNIERFEALGLEVQFTEMDLRIKAPITDEKIALQAENYKKLIEVALAHNVRTVVVWGITDLHSWVPSIFAGYGAALLFDNNYQPKPAYTSILDALKE